MQSQPDQVTRNGEPGRQQAEEKQPEKKQAETPATHNNLEKMLQVMMAQIRAQSQAQIAATEEAKQARAVAGEATAMQC